jgi:hypothetical protein
MGLVDSYGKCVDLYEGTGSLKDSTGKTFECEFEAGQLMDGTIVLVCTSRPGEYFMFSLGAELQFEGLTADGRTVRSRGRNTSINILAGRLDRPGSRTAFAPSELVVSSAEKTPAKLRFGLTNFRLSGQHVVINRTRHKNLLLRLTDHKKLYIVELRPVEDYKEIMLRVSTLKSIEVTCTAEVDVEKFGDIENIETVIGRLCLIASVARGTKVEWIYCDWLDEDGSQIRRTHAHRYTKPYSALSIIDYRGDDNSTRLFLEQAYTTFCKRCDDYELDRGTINSYIDAKSESDFIETRGAKLAVALEGLKHAFLHSKNGVSEFILPPSQFSELAPKLLKAIKDVLKEIPEISKSDRGLIATPGKMLSLNRQSFRDILEKLFEEIKLLPNLGEIKLFIACRNKLVHTGDFYCNAATPEERAICAPLASPVEEYFFLVNFLDRIFLKLLGYSGEYLNISKAIKGENEVELVDAMNL